MNKADNEAGAKAVDSLINYETVKVSALHCVLHLVHPFAVRVRREYCYALPMATLYCPMIN